MILQAFCTVPFETFPIHLLLRIIVTARSVYATRISAGFVLSFPRLCSRSTVLDVFLSPEVVSLGPVSLGFPGVVWALTADGKAQFSTRSSLLLSGSKDTVLHTQQGWSSSWGTHICCRFWFPLLCPRQAGCHRRVWAEEAVPVEQETRDVDTDHLLSVRWTLGRKGTWWTFSTFWVPGTSFHLKWRSSSLHYLSRAGKSRVDTLQAPHSYTDDIWVSHVMTPFPPKFLASTKILGHCHGYTSFTAAPLCLLTSPLSCAPRHSLLVGGMWSREKRKPEREVCIFSRADREQRAKEKQGSLI